MDTSLSVSSALDLLDEVGLDPDGLDGDLAIALRDRLMAQPVARRVAFAAWLPSDANALRDGLDELAAEFDRRFVAMSTREDFAVAHAMVGLGMSIDGVEFLAVDRYAAHLFDELDSAYRFVEVDRAGRGAVLKAS